MKGFNKIFLFSVLTTLLAISAANAQDEIFLYGRITTIDGTAYEGALRWGKEEVFWTDMFNASKDENKNLRYLSREERDYLEEERRDRNYNGWNNMVNFTWNDWDDDYDFIHQLQVQFGNIERITVEGREDILLEMRNGEVYELDGDGYNDIGSKIKVLDGELGQIEINWGRIEEIEFMETPKKLRSKFGNPLFGTVESDLGTFTGYIQWDHDERVGTDKLDGDTRDGDLSIDFDNIKSIERYGSSRSIVILKSGRDLELRGSNDVNDSNRGVIVTVDGLGRVDLDWDDFDKVTFSDAPSKGKSYSDFDNQKQLEGTVFTNEETSHSGPIIFDLDEAYEYEILNGKEDDSEYEIPFFNIKEISPRNYEYSLVKLRDGKTLTLGESQDVSDRHQGILVKDGSEPVYIPWEKVEKIVFD